MRRRSQESCSTAASRLRDCLRFLSLVPAGALLASLLGLSCASASERKFSIFAGVLTDNTWEDFLLTPWDTRLEDPGLLGIAVSVPLGEGLDTRLGKINWEVEFQIVRHTGPQSNWEFNLPITARLTLPDPLWGVIDTLAFGIGPSHASLPPDLELRRGGEAQRDQIYWHAEVEHRFADHICCSLFARIHHRSDGYGVIGEGGSSNGLVIGLRRSF